MKTFYTFLAIFLSINLWSQSPPNSNFNGLISTVCPFDSAITINQTDYWQIYQTLNDKWNGIIDSTRCISLEEVDNDLEIALNQIDPSKPIFIKSLMDDDTKVFLEPNSLHNSFFFINKSDGAILNVNEDCENGLCSGLIVGIEIPDSTGTEKAMRIYNTTASPVPSNVRAEICISTEKFDENYLKEFIIKLTFSNQDLDGEWLRLRYVYNEEMDWWGNFRIYDIPITDGMYNGSSYDVNLYDLSMDYAINGLLMNTDTTYPSPAHISYMEAHLLTNKPTQEIINFYIYGDQTLVYQPFTELRGGLIEGDDSLRHIVNLVNNGGTVCMPAIIEFTFDGSTHYVHKGGHVEFHGTTSCMLFKNGGTLNIAENTTFYYGNGGEGMLAICDGSTINIAKGGTLEIDNHMVLISNKFGEEGQIFMELNQGSTLRFDENAKLSRKGSNPSTRLNVYMNGGILDDHLLLETERQLINRIYPGPDENNNFSISPNPASEYFMASMVLENQGNISFKVIDMNGRLVQSYKKLAEKGYNEFEFNLKGLSNGMYLLKLESNELNACKKFIKL